MLPLVNDVCGGFNGFIKDQKNIPGKALVTLTEFNTLSKVLYSGVPISEVKELTPQTYQPGGGTALLDAVGKTINDVGVRLAATPEDQRPGKVIVLIITDGEENSSHEFNHAQIKDMITHQTEKYNWQFVYLSADMNAFTHAATMGILRAATIQFQSTPEGTQDLYKQLSRSVGAYRQTGVYKKDNP